MFYNRLTHTVIGMFLIGQIGMSGLGGEVLRPHSSAQTSSMVPSSASGATTLYFAPAEADPSLRMDFAELEYQHPLTLDQRVSLTPEVLESLSQEHLDQVYARLTAGPLPDGPYTGKAFLPQHHREQLTQAWQVMGLVVSSQTTQLYQRLEGRWMELWQGKVFDRHNKVLQNRVNLALVHDIAPLLAQRFAQALRTLPEEGLLFPAKMYCGQSKLDSRRESIILDYAYNDDLLPHFRPGIDDLVGRKKLHIRDEMRLIRPGLYLGRVYLGKLFLVNFLVINAEHAKAWERQETSKARLSSTHLEVQEDCWTGTHEQRKPPR
jgi:hypothetical protein